MVWPFIIVNCGKKIGDFYAKLDRNEKYKIRKQMEKCHMTNLKAQKDGLLVLESLFCCNGCCFHVRLS